jgi:peptidoglycan/xylan/chitin deacetylase (PgdA/CDA1 family)
MTSDLWHTNTPQYFWQCLLDLPQEDWDAAIRQALPALCLPTQHEDINCILAETLGEGQFGTRHWQFSPVKQLYYTLKPLFPRFMTTLLKRVNRYAVESHFPLEWPIERRFVCFQYDVIYQLLSQFGITSIPFKRFWPDGHRYAFVITHDIESAHGQAFAREVADLDERYGFRSSFNFVPERYPLDRALMQELMERGFEVGVHGLKHDGKLFRSYGDFIKRAKQINIYLKEFHAVGFRAPFTHRNPVWMQELEIEYDLSFFDTDPFEPLPGGTMTIWPFFMGHFVELPYTLAQDSTLISVLGETSPRLWLEKVNFVEEFGGMALVNTHPDYLCNRTTWEVYEAFLAAMRNRNGYWQALPRDVARWWRTRNEGASVGDSNIGAVTIQGKRITTS